MQTFENYFSVCSVFTLEVAIELWSVFTELKITAAVTAKSTK
jgi:hypothetical protein